MRSDNPVNKKAVESVSVGLSCFFVALQFLVVTPIWYYLLYNVLVRVQATELMMFLFWVYIPASLVTGILAKIVEKK